MNTLSDPGLEKHVIGALIRAGERQSNVDLVFETDAILGGPSAFDSTRDIIHQAAYEAVLEVVNGGSPPTRANVGAVLRKRGLSSAIVEEAAKDTTLSDKRAFDMGLDALVEFRNRRRAFGVLNEGISQIRNGTDASDVVAQAAGELLTVTAEKNPDGGSFGTLATNWERDQRNAVESPDSLWSMQWGYGRLIRLLVRLVEVGNWS